MFLLRILFLSLFTLSLYRDAETASCPIVKSKKRMICYFANDAGSNRPPPANIQPEDFDPCLCTHVLYSFVNLRNNKLALSDNDKNLLPRVAKWKLKNPFLKISISIGGWDEQSTHFIPMVATPENRNTFCQSVIDVCRLYTLDGIDIDWEYPQMQHTDQYTATIQTCYDMFQEETKTSGKARLLISAATAADGRMSSLDIPALNRLMDFVNPMTYDIHGSWDGNNAHHSPLYGWDGADTTLQRYIAAGMSPEKLNLGLAGYGRATGEIGPYTRESGALAYFEICPLLCKTWTSTYDETIKGVKAVNNGGYGHVFYDDVRSMADKAKYVMNSNIGGAFIWDVSLDDFRGDFCCQGKYPLISSVVNVLTGNDTYSTNKCCVSGTGITTTAPNGVVTTQPAGFTSAATNAPTAIATGKPIEIAGCSPSVSILPHRTDCNKFVRCVIDEKTGEINESVETCVSTLLFNPDLKVCDWPQNVACKTFSYATATLATTVATTTKNTIAGCTGSNKYAPHPNDCTKFVACSDGSQLACAIGLGFDITSESCKPAAELGCIPPTTTTTVPTTTTPPPDWTKCPNGKQFSQHQDCSKFYQCEKVSEEEYVDVERQCPGNLLFNLNIFVCDWPANVVCLPYTGTTKPPTTTTTTTALAEDQIDCLKDGLYPSPSKCSVYYECVDGVAKKKACTNLGALQTVFDTVKKNCYFPQSSKTHPTCV